MIEARLKLDKYTSQVLDVVKGKHGLKNRSEALKKLVEEHGENYVKKEPNEMLIKELNEKYDEHIKKHGFKSMDESELDEILGL